LILSEVKPNPINTVNIVGPISATIIEGQSGSATFVAYDLENGQRFKNNG
jgi:hypothetical protein